MKKALFRASKEVLNDKLNEKNYNKYFLLKFLKKGEMGHDNGNEHAVGLARHNAVVRDLYGSTYTTRTVLSGNSASGTSKVPSLTMPCVV